ncbi:hypothetical protein D1627_17290 [Pontibacter oryzae]|uniref:Lipoprotein n=2 Tax=Pontibacter oryzae TaxID=2304593 RepID=A0A399RQK6_9BACT|nr:hypothetical protein D1627_17290 [Pontibacter oryzae]
MQNLPKHYNNMKKVILMGTLCLALGMASCKTYCPAYSYAKDKNPVKETTAVASSSEQATDKVNS